MDVNLRVKRFTVTAIGDLDNLCTLSLSISRNSGKRINVVCIHFIVTEFNMCSNVQAKRFILRVFMVCLSLLHLK